MEGIYLYLMVVKVFNTIVKMKLFYAFSWGRYRRDLEDSEISMLVFNKICVILYQFRRNFNNIKVSLHAQEVKVISQIDRLPSGIS